MKKVFFLILAVILVFMISCAGNQEDKSGQTIIAVSDTAGSGYGNASGVFKGESRARYTGENYWGVAELTIEDGRITCLDFYIIDKAKNEVFGEEYERHFKGMALYQEQCRNEWAALQIYPEEFLKKQNMNNVDAISGATWSYNLMKASIEEALKKSS